MNGLKLIFCEWQTYPQSQTSESWQQKVREESVIVKQILRTNENKRVKVECWTDVCGSDALEKTITG
jgi:hypothetical protein